MAFTKIAAVGDALEAAIATAMVGQDPKVPVYRGGEWLLTSEALPDFVTVGYDGSRESEGGPAAVEDQEPAGQGGGWRTARGTYTCAVVSQSGDTDMDIRRVRVETLLNLIDTQLRGNPSLGGVIQFGWISSVTPFEQQNQAGSVARYVIGYRYEVWI